MLAPWIPFALALLCTDHTPAPRPLEGAPARSAATVAWTIAVIDPLGTPLEVRARIQAVAGGALYPPGPDPALLSHLGAGGHFYLDRTATLQVPPGEYDLMLGRGFEWKARSVRVNVARDTSTTFTLSRAFDLRPSGWYGGEMHAHSKHPPIEYPISTAQELQIARSEGLSVMHLLDQWDGFTGASHAASDSQTVLYVSYEHRNQTYGHAVLPGLQQPVTDVCCLAPEPPYPMLLDLAETLRVRGEPPMVLGHPRTTASYAQASGWPGAGLGRELPVLLAHRALGAMDVVSYSNDPDTLWRDWYDALSAGFHLPPSAGSDAVLNWYNHSPPGGWRVYAGLGAGAPLDYAAWLAAFRRGRTFVTGYPLIPRFEVNGLAPGDTLDVTRDSVNVQVSWSARCAIELRTIRLIANGACVLERPTPSRPLQHDTTFTIRVAAPGWLALQVHGIQGFVHAAPAIPVAHTAAIWLQRDGQSRRGTLASARWLDDLDVLEGYLEARSGWAASWQRDSALARIARSRAVYAAAFVVPPGAFGWIEPASAGASAGRFEWTAAADDEPGDRVRYRVVVTPSAGGAPVIDTLTGSTEYEPSGLTPGASYFVTVHAHDRSGTGPEVSGGARAFVHVPASALSVPSGRASVARAWPNPGRGPLMIDGFAAGTEVLDAAGRRVAWLGAGLAREGTRLLWTRTHDGRPIAPGVYLVRERGSARTLRVIRLE